MDHIDILTLNLWMEIITRRDQWVGETETSGSYQKKKKRIRKKSRAVKSSDRDQQQRNKNSVQKMGDLKFSGTLTMWFATR